MMTFLDHLVSNIFVSRLASILQKFIIGQFNRMVKLTFTVFNALIPFLLNHIIVTNIFFCKVAIQGLAMLDDFSPITSLFCMKETQFFLSQFFLTHFTSASKTTRLEILSFFASTTTTYLEFTLY